MLPATQIAKVVSGDRPSQLPTWHDSRLASVCDEVGGSNPRMLRARVRLRARLTAAAAHRHAAAQLDCRRHGDEEEHRPVRQPGACRIRSQRSAWAHSTTPGGDRKRSRRRTFEEESNLLAEMQVLAGRGGRRECASRHRDHRAGNDCCCKPAGPSDAV